VVKDATQTFPIITLTADPIALGLAASLSRPGGNVTGVVPDVGLSVREKRFELLREVAPAIVAFPFFRDAWENAYAQGVRQAAVKVGISLSLSPLTLPLHEAEYRRAFTAMRNEQVGAVAIPDIPSTFAHRQLIVQLVQELALPAVYPFREFVDGGGLMSYSSDLPSLWRHAARQVDQILKGAKPGEIPFYQTTKFELIINLKTAKALGLTMPPSLLARADEVIE